MGKSNGRTWARKFDFTGLWFAEWSEVQGMAHLGEAEECLKRNARMAVKAQTTGYTPIWIGSYEECADVLNEFHKFRTNKPTGRLAYGFKESIKPNKK